MNIAPILLLKNESIVPEVSGIIKELYKPSNPSPAQEKHNIHPQDMVVVGDDGVEVKVQLMSKDHHVPPSSKNRHISIKSSNGERGLSGIKVNIYAPEGKQPSFKLCCDRFCSIVITDPSLTKQQDAGKPQDPRQPGAISGQGRFTRPTLEDHEACLMGMVERFATFFAGEITTRSKSPGTISEASMVVSAADLALRAATTIYIQASKDGIIPVKAATEPPKQEQETKTLGKAEVFSKVVADSLAGTLNIEKAKLHMASHGIKWEEIYDDISAKLTPQYGKEAVEAAHDSFRKIFLKEPNVGLNDEAFYAVLIGDIKTFIDEVASLTSQSDNIPL